MCLTASDSGRVFELSILLMSAIRPRGDSCSSWDKAYVGQVEVQNPKWLQRAAMASAPSTSLAGGGSAEGVVSLKAVLLNRANSGTARDR